MFCAVFQYSNRCLPPTLSRIGAGCSDNDGKPSSEAEQGGVKRTAGQNVLYKIANQALVQRIHGN